MITIQIDGKTYKSAKYNTVEREVKRMITLGELEEVKENKDSLENSSEIPNSSPISKMETTQFTPGQEEQVILPEGAIPRFLHSQFPNNKPGKN